MARKRLAISNRMIAEGWTVFPTSTGFPDLMCVKGGKVRLIKVYDKDTSGDPARAVTVEAMRAAGLTVEIKGIPANPKHDGHRIIKSVNIKAEDQPFYGKLRQILKSNDKSLSTWFKEQMVSYVMEEMGGSP